MRLKQPIPADWKLVPEYVQFGGKRSKVWPDDGQIFTKTRADGEVVLVTVKTTEVLVGCSCGISTDEALAYAVEICTPQVGERFTLM